MVTSLRGLSYTDKRGPIKTLQQLGGQGAVQNTALVIPGHLGKPWSSLEYVCISAAADGEQPGVGEHMQATDEIYYILSGKGWLTTNGKGRPVGAGGVVVAPKGTRHSIHNLDNVPLEFFVAEVSAAEEMRSPAMITSLPSFLQASEEIQVVVGKHAFPLLCASVDLSTYFSPAWGALALLEIPPGGRILERQEPCFDENLFLIDGNATFLVQDIPPIHSGEDGLNVLVPRGIPSSIINRSSVAPLLLLCLQVRPER